MILITPLFNAESVFFQQLAKKIVSKSLRQVDFVGRQKEPVFFMPNGQLDFSGKGIFFLTKEDLKYCKPDLFA